MALSGDVRATIQEQYPGFAWLMDVPGVGELLERAVNEGWPEGRFISSLYATDWYRQRSESERQLETLRALDPRTAFLREQEAFSSVRDMAGRLGINFSWGEMQYLAASQIGRGLSVDDPEERIHILNWVRGNPGRVSNTGTIYQNAQMADNLYRNEFFYVPNWDDMIKVGVELALGYQTEENVRQNLAEWFSGVTPHLASRLKAGETYATIVNPFRDIIAKELELGDLNAVDMTASNQWRWLLGKTDDASGEMRLPTQQEVIAAARSDTRWKSTINGTGLATSLVDGITKSFGVRT